MEAEQEKFFSVREMVRMFDLNERTVRRWIADGKIATVKFGPRLIRIPEGSIRAFLGEGSQRIGTVATIGGKDADRLKSRNSLK